jgi:hypothetical protein
MLAPLLQATAGHAGGGGFDVGGAQPVRSNVRRLSAVGLLAVLALLLAGATPQWAGAGGPFVRLVGVGAHGAWRALPLAPSGRRSDASLFSGGQRLPLPRDGYVRLFPFGPGLPGVPGRYFPAERALCWSWRQPDRDCRRANENAVRLLEPLATLPLRRQAPTVLVQLRYRGRLVRPALANLRVGLELAFDRPGRPAARVPRSALRFTGRWRGPAVGARPQRFALGPAGAYGGGLLYPLDRGVWSYADANRVPGPATAGLTVRVASGRPMLYGFAGPPPRLVRVDPVTLRPLPGRRVPPAGHNVGWSFSPDHSRLALGSDTPRAELRLVDLRRMRVLGDVKLARTGSVFATAWAGDQRLLAVLLTPGCCGLGDTTVTGVDAAGRRVLWRRGLGGSLQAGERFRRSLVLVLGPPGRRTGDSRLVVVNADGRVRSAPLREIRSGLGWSSRDGQSRFVTDVWNPGLAVDSRGARAFVAQAGAPVAEVDLRTLRVRYHSLAEPISLLGRLHDWLEPKAEAKADQGPTRRALWLGNGLLAVTGFDGHAGLDSRGGQSQWELPAGLKLIDTRRWSVHTLDSRATDAAFVAGTLLAWSLAWDSRTNKVAGSGLSGYAVDGSRRFHLYGRDPISGVQPLGPLVLVGGSSGSHLFRQAALLDARTGRELRRVRSTVELLVGDEPFWY